TEEVYVFGTRRLAGRARPERHLATSARGADDPAGHRRDVADPPARTGRDAGALDQAAAIVGGPTQPDLGRTPPQRHRARTRARTGSCASSRRAARRRTGAGRSAEAGL